MGTNKTGWEQDQWGTNPFADGEDKLVNGKGKRIIGTSKTADMKAAASAAFDKAKAAASIGAHMAKGAAATGAKKVKSGTPAGMQWLKKLYQKSVKLARKTIKRKSSSKPIW